MHFPDRVIFCHYVLAALGPGTGRRQQSQQYPNRSCPDFPGTLRTLPHAYRPHRDHYEDSHGYADDHGDTQQYSLTNSPALFLRHGDTTHTESRSCSNFDPCFYCDLCTPCAAHSAPRSAIQHIRTTSPTDSASAAAHPTASADSASSTASRAYLTTRPAHESSLPQSAGSSHPLSLKSFFNEKARRAIPPLIARHNNHGAGLVRVRITNTASFRSRLSRDWNGFLGGTQNFGQNSMSKKGRLLIEHSILFAGTGDHRPVYWFVDSGLDRFWRSG